jgi:hypothetical protein
MDDNRMKNPLRPPVTLARQSKDTFRLEILGVLLLKFLLLFALWYVATGRMWNKLEKESGAKVEEHLFPPMKNLNATKMSGESP